MALMPTHMVGAGDRTYPGKDDSSTCDSSEERWRSPARLMAIPAIGRVTANVYLPVPPAGSR